MRKIASHVRGHLVAYLALFFALGGTSMAAANALPRNSVGSPQIKNGSIQKVDISKRTVTALRGARGPRGLQGATGAKGDKGDKGDTGATGPSASFMSTATADHTIPEPGGGLGTPIASLDLSAGSYLVQVTGSVTRLGLTAGQGATHTFQIRRDGAFINDAFIQVTTVQGSTGAAVADFAMTKLMTVTGTQTITLVGFDTTAAGTSSSTQHVSMTATLVGSATGAL